MTCQCTRILTAREEFRKGSIAALSDDAAGNAEVRRETNEELEKARDNEFGSELEMAFGVSAAFGAGIDTVFLFALTLSDSS